jgi:hypothetical protein
LQENGIGGVREAEKRRPEAGPRGTSIVFI